MKLSSTITRYLAPLDSQNAGSVFSQYGQGLSEISIPLVLNQPTVDDGKASFAYSYHDNGSNQSFLQNLSVNWQQFSAKVLSLNNALPQPVAEVRLALRFIHRYMVNQKRWYVTVQLCSIDGAPLPNSNMMRRHENYTLTPLDAYFDVMPDGSIQDNGTTGLAGTIDSWYGQDYFDNVFYGGNKVVAGINTQSATFCWFEISKLYTDNLTPSTPIGQQFTLVLASVSYKLELPSTSSIVEFPHSMALHMCYNGSNCLDGGDIVLGNFLNKAANYNSLCPPRCNGYAWHADIARPS